MHDSSSSSYLGLIAYRDAWARETCKATDAAGQTYIVQTLRNSITASSLLATACSLIAVTGVGNIILDEQKLNMLERIVVSLRANVVTMLFN